MYEFMIFLHVVGSLTFGFYLILPFVFSKVAKLALPVQEGTLSTVKTLNTYAQIGLVIQLLTGGYLMSKGEYSTAWMIVIVLLFLAIGAVGGIMGKPLRQKDTAALSGKLRTLSIVAAVLVLAIIYFMVNRYVI